MSFISRESSLTAPEDRDKVNKWKPDQFCEPLTTEQLSDASSVLNVTFPKIDRVYADPVVPMQNIALFSFMPVKGATPNENGIYGFAKIRGVYPSEMEANQRAEFLIRNVDSFNTVFHTHVGRPFPVTVKSDFSAETSEIDIRKQATETMSSNIKSKKDDEVKIVQELKQREEALLADVKNEEVDPYEEYITQKVKYAQLAFTYTEHQKKMAEVKEIIIKTRHTIKELDEAHPDFRDSYFDKYKQARISAGLKEDMISDENFVRFMVVDVDLGF